jgi:hypothetical protein
LSREANGKKLPLSLRRDRGYIYFPDAIQECLFAMPETVSGPIMAECYKTSSREIYLEKCTEGKFNRKEKGLFGAVFFRQRGNVETWLLREFPQKIQNWFDLTVPIISVELRVQALGAEFRANDFSSESHRFAHLCKLLCHTLIADPGDRMLLQRIRLESPVSAPGVSGEDSVKLELFTKERFVVFSLWRNGRRIGELFGAIRRAVKMDET